MAYTNRLDFGPYGDFGNIQFPQQKESGMPWAAIIPAAASVVGSVVASRSANKATKAQTKANDQALAYQREQDTMSRADWNRAMQAWEANRNALLRRLGVDVPTSGYAQPQVAQAAPQPEIRRPMGPAVPEPAGQSIQPGAGNLAAMIGRGGYTGRRGGSRYGFA